MEKIKLDILGLTISQVADSYILLLRDKESDKRLPIIIGSNEAQSIVAAMDNLHPPRPLTHDVFFNVLTHFEIELKEVYIHDIIKGTFCAEMLCERHADAQRFDVRTSDAIAMALRFNAPIYTNENVMNAAGVEPNTEINHGEKGKKRNLMNLSAEELKKGIEEAVEKEDYETASLLRDILKKKNNLR